MAVFIDGHEVLDRPVITTYSELRGTSPDHRVRETDQVAPAGMWRWRYEGDTAILQRATAVGWAAAEDWLTLDKPNEEILLGKNAVLNGVNLIFDPGNRVTITVTNPAAARTLTIPAIGGDRTFPFLEEAQSWTATQTINDDILLRLGTDADQVFLNCSAGLAADTALANVLVDAGAIETQAIAANSLIISNITASGDIGIYINNGGNSLEVLHADGSAGMATIGHGLAGLTLETTVANTHLSVGANTGSYVGSNLEGGLVYGRDDDNAHITVIRYSDTGQSAPSLLSAHSRGTRATPLTLENTDYTGDVVFGGWNGADWFNHFTMRGVVQGQWTGANASGYVEFTTMPAGSIAYPMPTRMYLDDLGVTIPDDQSLQLGGTPLSAADATLTSNGTDITVALGSGANWIYTKDTNIIQLTLRGARTGLNHSIIAFDQARGTVASPDPIASGDDIGSIYARPYDGAGYDYGAHIGFWASENQTATAHGQEFRVYTIDNTTTTADLRWTIGQDGNFGGTGAVVIKSQDATEIGFQVTNAALTVGSEGSLIAPYYAAAGAIGSDALYGNQDGAIGILHDTSPGADTIEVRVNGAWLSVAVAGVLFQKKVSYYGFGWKHENQIYKEDGRTYINESLCAVCGEPIDPQEKRAALYWPNAVSEKGVHAIPGHLHLEREPRFSELEDRVKAVAQAQSIVSLKSGVKEALSDPEFKNWLRRELVEV